jgi:hypothetical protein
MTLIQKLKAFFALRRIAKEATKMDETTLKPGWKTTEFWGKTIIQLIVVFNALSAKDIPLETATAIVASLEGIYIAGRSVVKAVKDILANWKK